MSCHVMSLTLSADPTSHKGPSFIHSIIHILPHYSYSPFSPLKSSFLSFSLLPYSLLSYPLLFFPLFLLPLLLFYCLLSASSSSFYLHLPLVTTIFQSVLLTTSYFTLLLRHTGVASVPAEATVADGIAQSLAISYNNAGKKYSHNI